MDGSSLFRELLLEMGFSDRGTPISKLVGSGFEFIPTEPIPGLAPADGFFSKVNGYNVYTRPGEEKPLLQVSLAHILMMPDPDSGAWKMARLGLATTTGRDWVLIVEGAAKEIPGKVKFVLFE